ncbi:hypothetical protein D3C87_1101430 [compost metagenome]
MAFGTYVTLNARLPPPAAPLDTTVTVPCCGGVTMVTAVIGLPSVEAMVRLTSWLADVVAVSLGTGGGAWVTSRVNACCTVNWLASLACRVKA